MWIMRDYDLDEAQAAEVRAALERVAKGDARP